MRLVPAGGTRARRGRPPTPVVLTDDERQALTSLAHRSRTAPQQARRARIILACADAAVYDMDPDRSRVARRARIILACADGQPTTGIAKRLHLSPTTVCKWRTSFLAGRLDGLADEPRPGAPRRITDAQVEDVVVRALESTPPGATHWSTRGMAKATGLSPHHHQPDLAHLRIAAAPDRDVQAVAGADARRARRMNVS